MQGANWADRGRQLVIGEEGPAPTQCIGLSRLGAATVPASLLSVFIQVRGSAWVEAREGKFELGPGDWIIFDRDSCPRVQVGGRGVCIGIVPDGAALTSLETLVDRVLYPGRGKLTRSEARTTLRLWRNAARGGDAHALRPLLMHLAEVQRDLAKRIAHCPGRSRSHKRQVFGRMQRARLYLEGNSHRVVRIDELAELANFSSWYFSKAFHGLYGESPQSLSGRLRLERAARLLRSTSMMVGEVAAASGFDNACSFARAFRARYGVTATRYRQRRTGSAKAAGGAGKA